MSLAKFRHKASQDSFRMIRADFRENYTYIENYCHKNYGKGDYLDWLSNQIDIVNENEETITRLVELKTVRSSNYRFRVTPTVKEASDFLRQKFIDETVDSNYPKNESRAVLVILQQIRDNLTHYGKFETDDAQYKRNFELVSLATLLTTSIIDKIEK